MRNFSSFSAWSFAALFVVGSACSTTESAQQSDKGAEQASQRWGEAAFVWNGFEHAWTYNHRLNRLGDYIEPFECDKTADGDDQKAENGRTRCRSRVVHTGASGTGKDELQYGTHWTEVRSRSAHFAAGRADLAMTGDEETLISREKTVEIGADDLADRDDYTVLLNGFDLHTKGPEAKAKKIKELRVGVDDATWNDQSEKVEATVHGAIDMNCDSVECKRQSDDVTYELSVYWLVVGGDNALHATSKSYDTKYQWNKKEELKGSKIPGFDKPRKLSGEGQRFDAGFAGFSELSAKVDRPKKKRYGDHWFVKWVNRIDREAYDREAGTLDFHLRLMFKQWNKKTKRRPSSFAQKGRAEMSAEVTFVQLANSTVERDSASGSFVWRGRRPADTDEATDTVPIEFTY